jgi:hypothetical protein
MSRHTQTLQCKTIYITSSTAYCDGSAITLSWPGLDGSAVHLQNTEGVDSNSKFILVENTDPNLSIVLERYAFGLGALDTSAPTYEGIISTLAVSGDDNDISLLWPRYMGVDKVTELDVILPPGKSLIHYQVQWPSTLPASYPGHSFHVAYRLAPAGQVSSFTSVHIEEPTTTAAAPGRP